MTIKGFNEKLNEIKEYCETLNRQNDNLREVNKELKEEQYKDKELAKMKHELEIARKDNSRGFPISEEEEKAIDTWMNTHPCCYRNYSCGAIGGRYVYEFWPTSIGVLGIIRCSCGNEFTFQNMT